MSQLAPNAQQRWYTIRNLAPVAAAAQAALDPSSVPSASAAEVLIYGDIGESWWAETVSARDFVAEIAALQVDKLTVRIASIGGSVPDGIGIYNALKRHPASVTCVVDSIAYSIASLIAMAGDRVEMAANALLMVHAPWAGIYGNAEELRRMADVLDTYARAMATSYVAKTGKGTDEILALLSDGVDHYYTADEALVYGFVDAIVQGPEAAADPEPAQARARVVAMAKSRYPRPAPTPSLPAAAAAQPQEQATMPQANQAPAANQQAANSTNPAAPAVDPAALAAARDEGVRAEVARRQTVQAAFDQIGTRFGDLSDVQAQCLADPAIDADEAGRRILARAGRGASPAGQITTEADERDKIRAAMTNAVLARGGAVGEGGRVIAMDTANPFRGRTLLEIAEACVRATGRNTAGMDKFDIVSAAFVGQSTSDFPVLLENIMHKSLLGAFKATPDKWRLICAVGSVGDLREHNRYRTGSIGNLDDLDEHGEYKNKQIPDGEKAKVKVGKKGNIIAITDELVINDDLGALVGLSTMLGRAAARTIETSVWSYLASNPVIDDGIALFHASHNNLAGTAAAPTTASLTAARLALAKQKDIGGNEFLDIVPGIAVCPLELGDTFRTLNGSEYDPEAANKLQKPNTVRNMVSQIVDTPRLSGTGWAVFADPSINPVIEVSFLDGVQEPRITTQDGWRVDGAEMKVMLRWGVKAIDYRGAYWNAGA